MPPTRSTDMANSFDPAQPTRLGVSVSQLLLRRNRHLGAPYRLFYQRPVHLTHGSGVLLFDDEGNEYLDAYNNVPVVGHSNPRVQQAVHDQLGRLNTHTRYLTDGVVDYAEELLDLFPPSLSQVMFTCTGSEAVDLAIRVARLYTGAQGVIATRHAYHGTTQAAVELSPALGPNPAPSPAVILIDAPDMLRDDPNTTARDFADRLEAAIAEFQRRGIKFAGLILDSVLSSDGLQVDPMGLLGPAVDAVHHHGGLFIADEVQAGFGRTGSHWWGFARHQVVPDLVVLGKPMGNGLPIAAVVGGPELFDRFSRETRYFNTFGGTPVTVAAAAAVLAELKERDLLANGERVGQLLRNEIETVTSDNPAVAQVRATGLFLALELVDVSSLVPDPVAAARVVNHMRDNRILISASGSQGHVLKIRPPLVFDESHVSRLIEGLAAALAEGVPTPT